MKRVALSLVMVLAFAGCQTTGGTDDASDKPPRRGTDYPFEPASTTAYLTFDGGSYPTLFEAGAPCRWIQPGAGVEAGSMAEQAQQMAGQFHVFECHMKSAFADSSIAYDVTGLRGISIILRAPDGTEVPSARTVLDPNLTESAFGALPVYSRTVYLLFPKIPLSAVVPYEGQGYRPLQIVLRGYDSVFTYSFPPVAPTEIRRERFRESNEAKVIKEGYEVTRDGTREFLHNFD